MKNKLFFTATFLLAFLSLSQNSARILTPNFHSDIITPNFQLLPTNSSSVNGVIGYQGLLAKASQNIQMDASGEEILFFIVDDVVYSRKGLAIGKLMGGNSPSYEPANGMVGEMAIIPSDVCENEFFIIGTYKGTGVEGFRGFWDKVTVLYDDEDNLIGNSGLASTGVNPTTSFTFTSMIGSSFLANNNTHDENVLIASTKELSSGNRFIYLQNGYKIFRLKIQNGALVYDNYSLDLSTILPILANNLRTVYRQEMEIIQLPNNGNLRLAMPVESIVGQALEIGYVTLDFSATTGNYIANSQKKITYPYTTNNKVVIKGAELSPNGERLYLTHNSTSAYPSTIDVFNLTNANPFSTRTVVSTSADYKDSQIETGPSGSMLIPKNNGISKIINSNAPTFPTDFEANSIGLTSYLATCPLTSNCTSDYFVRLMQDQIDDETYSNYGGYTMTIDSYSLATNETWAAGSNPFSNASVIYVLDNITIPANRTLTISGNLVIKFAPNARLIIQAGNVLTQGGKLILDGATLKADDQCGNFMWRGVEVRGVNSLAQGTMASSVQGRLEMKNNARIEHAIYGAITLGYNKTVNSTTGAVTFSSIANSQGGLIQATNSTFFNNQNGARFETYSNGASDNQSTFTNCSFLTTGLLNNPTLVLGNHIGMNAVKGIKIYGCTFENTTPSLYALDKLGVGIGSVNAGFFAYATCLVPGTPNCYTDPNVFKNLTYGIGAYTYSGLLTFVSDRNHFINNAIGISATGTKSPIIRRNTFNVREITTNSGNPITQSAGLRLEGSTAYTVTDNTFSEFDDPTIANGTANSYGIVVINSGIEHNEIYKNTFTKLKIGGQAEGTNGRTINSVNDPVDAEGKMSGLQWRCNIFNAPIYKHDLAVVDGKIDYHQGYADPTSLLNARLKAANNKFSQWAEGMPAEHDFRLTLTSQYINYVHTNTTNTSASNNYVPDSYTGLRMSLTPAQYNGSTVSYDATGCPTRKEIILEPMSMQMSSTSGVEETEGLYAERQQELSDYEVISSFLLSDSEESQLVEFVEGSENPYSIRIQKQVNYASNAMNASLHANENSVFGNFEKWQEFKDMYINESLNSTSFDKAFYAYLEQLSKDESDVQTASEVQAFLLCLNDSKVYRFKEFTDQKSQEEIVTETSITVEEMHVYPNPTSDKLTISYGIEEDATLNIKVYSITGQLVLESTLAKNDSQSIRLGHLKEGFYLVEVSQNQHILGTHKVQIK